MPVARRHDEPLIATDKIEFHGQTIFAVIAETRDAARKAARLAKVEYRDLPFWTDIDGAMENGSPLVTPGMTLILGMTLPREGCWRGRGRAEMISIKVRIV
mgnify:CR=1 FL=1